jgi:hypothetical protein
VARWRGGEVARWRGGEVARWRGGEVARWRGGEVAKLFTPWTVASDAELAPKTLRKFGRISDSFPSRNTPPRQSQTHERPVAASPRMMNRVHRRESVVQRPCSDGDARDGVRRGDDRERGRQRGAGATERGGDRERGRQRAGATESGGDREGGRQRGGATERGGDREGGDRERGRQRAGATESGGDRERGRQRALLSGARA